MPDPSAGPGIERKALIRSGHVHDPVNDDWRDLQLPGVWNRKHPPGRETRDGGFVDLRERGVPVTAGVSVVCGPRRLGGHPSKAIARAAQQVDPSIIGPQLHVVDALAEHLAIERVPVGGLQRHPHHGTIGGTALDRAQELHEIRPLAASNHVWRHAFGGQALLNQFGQLSIGECHQTQGYRRSHLTAVAIGAMTPGAANLERLAAGIDVLCEQICSSHEQAEQGCHYEWNAHGCWSSLHLKLMRR
jgi:hypothetical protein